MRETFMSKTHGYTCCVLVVENYDPTSNNEDTAKTLRKKKPSTKNLMILQKGDIIVVKQPLKWWLEVDIPKTKQLSLCSMANNQLNDTTVRDIPLFIPSIVCVPVDVDKLNSNNEDLTQITQKPKKLFFLMYSQLRQCL